MDPLQTRYEVARKIPPINTYLDVLSDATSSSPWSIDPATPHDETQIQPTATYGDANRPISNLTCLHLYATIKGRYPKLGLFCNGDESEEEVDSDSEVATRALSKRIYGSETLQLAQTIDTTICHTESDEHSSSRGRKAKTRGTVLLPSDQGEVILAPARRTAPKAQTHGGHNSDQESAIPQVGIKRAASPLPAERINRRHRINTTESSKKRKRLIEEGSADEAVEDGAEFSRRDSDDEYVPGPTWRPKGRTMVGRKETKSLGANSRRIALEGGASSVKHSSWQSSGYSKRRRVDTTNGNPSIVTQGTDDRTGTIPASSERRAKKRNLVDDQADGEPSYNVKGESRSGRDNDSNRGPQFGIASKVGGKKLQRNSNVALGKHNRSKPGAPATSSENKRSQGNKRRRAETTDESSGISDDSDEEFIPGPGPGPGPKTKAALKKSKKMSTTRNNKRRKVKIEQDSLRSADTRSTQIIASASPTTNEYDEVDGDQETDELLEVARESDGRYRCLRCKHWTTSRGDMNRHLESLQHRPKGYVCLPECLSTFTRKDSLKRHVENRHKGKAILIDEIRKTAYRVQ